MAKVQADTDLGNGWTAADLQDAIQVHGLEYLVTEFDMSKLDNIPGLHKALVGLTTAVLTFNNTLDKLGFDDLETEDF